LGPLIPEANFEENFGEALEDTLKVLKAEKASQRIDVGKIDGDLVELSAPPLLAIVSDLHGDYGTLRKILSELDIVHFFNNPKNKAVFLGDYVDRGRNSVNVLYSLFRLKLDHPHNVVLMRGNHEAPREFPFRQHDLPANLEATFFAGRSLYEKILTVFDELVVATIVKDCMVLVHGGLPIANPASGELLSRATKDRKILEEILWNDPRELPAEYEKSRRSYGFHFGETVTDRWLRGLGVKVVVRGHEPSKGYEIHHGGKVLTLFSCQESYPAHEAAYILLSSSDLEVLRNANDLIANIHRL
jgi:hypothetical protein